MNDQGVVDRSQYNHGPANAKLGDTVGFPRPSHKKPYHELNYIRIDKKIRGITDMFTHFAGLESIELSAKAKLKTFYYNLHPEDADDNDLKMPHGGAAFAAACFYAATLEFEANPCRGMNGTKTQATLAVICEYAQSEVDRKRDHRGICTTRKVTPLVILRRTQDLGDLCQAKIPALTSQSLLWTSDTSAKEHGRMALFKECGAPKPLYLPKKGEFGLQIEDTGQGALVVSRVDNDKIAYRQGFRVGDYILFFQDEEVKATDTVHILKDKIKKAMKETGRVELLFIVKRKNADAQPTRKRKRKIKR
jgi:hypothetical protein